MIILDVQSDEITLNNANANAEAIFIEDSLNIVKG